MSYYFNVKEYNLKQITELANEYQNRGCSICILYPNYNLSTDEIFELDKKISSNVDWNITLVENEYFTLKESLHPNKYSCYNNISLEQIANIDKMFDIVIFTRIVEHLTADGYLYFLHLLKSIITKNSKILVTYPDMDVITNEIRKISSKKNIDLYQYNLWNIELFNSFSSNVYDYHKIYTNQKIIKYLSEYENLYKVVDTSELFAISSDRKCYRTSCLVPIVHNIK